MLDEDKTAAISADITGLRVKETAMIELAIQVVGSVPDNQYLDNHEGYIRAEHASSNHKQKFQSVFTICVIYIG